MVKRRTKKRGGGDEVAKKFPTTKKEFLRALENNIHLEKEVNLALKKARNSKIKIKMPNNFDEMLENIKKNKNVDKILKKMGEVYSKIIKQRKRRVQKKKIRGGGDGDDDEGDGEEKNGGDDDDDDSNIDYENLDIGGPDSQVCYRAAFTKWALLVAGGTAASGALIHVYMTLPSMSTITLSAASLAQVTGSTITSVQRFAEDAGIDTVEEQVGTGLGIAAILAYLVSCKEVFKPIVDSIKSIVGGGRDGSLLFVTYLIVNDYCKCMREKQSSLKPEGREDYRNKCDEKKNFVNEVYHIYALIADILPGFSPMPKEFRQRKIPNIIRIIQQRLGTTVHPPLDPEGDNVLGGMEVDNRGVAINRLVAQNQGGLPTIPTEAEIRVQMGRERRARAAEDRTRRRGLRRRRPVNNNNSNNQQQQAVPILRQRTGNPQEQQQPAASAINLRPLSDGRQDARRVKTHEAGGGRRKTKRRRKVKKTKKRKMKKRKRKTNKKRRRTKRK